MIGRLILLLLLALSAGAVEVVAQADTTRSGDDSTATTDFVMTKSPTAAVLWGLLPGGGQVYTEQYWKVPLFLVPIGTFVGFGLYYNGECNRFDDEALALGSAAPGFSLAIANRENARDNRDVMYAFAGGIWILSLVDAYVGAHLFDFDVGDSLSQRQLRLFPDPVAGGIAVSYSW